MTNTRTFISCDGVKNALIKYNFYKTRKMHMGVLMVITGNRWDKTGVGKSYSAMKIGELTDKTFHIGRVADTPYNFVKCFDEMEHNVARGSGKPIASQVAIMDEGQIIAPNTAYQTITNKGIFYTMSTFRYLHAIAIICTPSFLWIDKRMRTLCNIWGECYKEIDDKGKPSVKMKVYEISTDDLGEQIIFRKMRFYDKSDKRIKILNSYKVGYINENLAKEYEDRHTEFKKRFRTDILKEMELFDKKYSVKDDSGNVTQKLNDVAKIICDDKALMGELINRGRINQHYLDFVLEDKQIIMKSSQRTALKRIIEKLWKGGK